MSISERAVLHDKFVLYIVGRVEEDQVNWLSLREWYQWAHAWYTFQHASSGGTIENIAVGYKENIPCVNSLPCISYVPGIVTIERSKVFDEYRSGPFHRCGTWGQATGNVTHSNLVASLLFLPSDDMQRKLQRSTTNKLCNREQKKPTGNVQTLRVYISPYQVSLYPVPNFGFELL